MTIGNPRPEIANLLSKLHQKPSPDTTYEELRGQFTGSLSRYASDIGSTDSHADLIDNIRYLLLVAAAVSTQGVDNNVAKCLAILSDDIIYGMLSAYNQGRAAVGEAVPTPTYRADGKCGCTICEFIRKQRANADWAGLQNAPGSSTPQ